jgi:hypothetical protein
MVLPDPLPGTTYIVSTFKRPFWRNVLTTTSKTKAEAKLRQLNVGRVETVKPWRK